MLGLLTDFDDKQRMAYDNELLIKMLEEPSRLIKYKQFKLAITVLDYGNNESELQYIN